MINELYGLSEALNQSKIQLRNWHENYTPIPKIRKNAPCICITVSGGKIVSLSQLDEKFDKILRKYGSNQGSYPCMNLAPLYRIKDKTIKAELANFIKYPEQIDDAVVHKMKAWCTENNWGEKFQNKYKISMENTPAKLQPAEKRYEPLQILLNETKCFTNMATLHDELARVAWKMVENRQGIALALTILFYPEKDGKKAEEYGSLSVAFESEALIDNGTPAISEKFVLGLNQSLLDITVGQRAENKNDTIDAFGDSFAADETPMPKIKLAGGFDVSLRTMFDEVPCQYRYGKSGNASYLISQDRRAQLQAALEWIGGIGAEERKDQTWTITDKNEVLFVYPATQIKSSFTTMFKRPPNDKISFTTRSKNFIQQLNSTRTPGTDSRAAGIQIFILHKIDKGRSKVIYTRQTDANELEKCSDAWTCGCANLPIFRFGTPQTPYPLDTADILNCFWKQNGTTVTDKFKPFPKYHGIELLMEPDLPVTSDLHRLAESAMTIGPFLGNLSAKNEKSHSIWDKSKDMLAIMGLLLYRKHIGKEQYMENLPYLYGQLLKAADELHALYCKVVRNGDIPPQLAGSELFQSAAEAPTRTMQMLSRRIMPYYTWAKSYRLKNVQELGKESWRAQWLYHLYEQIAVKLQSSWTEQTRFNDAEKAQLFIGYLASFPKREQPEQMIEEEEVHE